MDMIERVTKAIFDAMDVTDVLDTSSAERYARAAILAMREPSAVMFDAAKKAEYRKFAKPGESMSTTNAQTIRLHFNAMIDAALAEE